MLRSIISAAAMLFVIISSSHGAVSWTHDGFDFTVTGGTSVHQWDPYTKQRYVMVPAGGEVTITVKRNSNLRDVMGNLNSAGNTRVHVGTWLVASGQGFTPDWNGFTAQGGFVYSAPFKVSGITAAKPVQVWNQHPGVQFNTQGKDYYCSNGVLLWLIPDNLTPGNVTPGHVTNGQIPAGQLINAPAGRWPALYKDNTDKKRLQDAISAKITTTSVRGVSTDYDRRGGGGYWEGLAKNCVTNALLGWNSASQPHLAEAKKQLLALLSVHIFGMETGSWYRGRTSPSADQATAYGRDITETFFNSFTATCLLGPNMANGLSAAELEAINAHLYYFGINIIYNCTVDANYISADGGINMHWSPITSVSGWNWNVQGAIDIHKKVGPTHTECTFFIDGSGAGQYALRYCQQWDPSNKTYEGTGNLQAARWYVRYTDIFKKWTYFDEVGYIDVARKTGLPAMLKYVRDRCDGQSSNLNRIALDCLLEKWSWVPGSAVFVSFDASPRRGQPPMEVTFTNTSQGDYTTWAWDFGDGNSSTLKDPKHTYTDFGTYTVKLTGSGGTAGSETYTWTDCIKVKLDALVIEAEDMTLTNYIVDSRMNNQGIMLDTTGVTQGTGTATFSGATGTYNMTVVASPENDGQPTLKVYVDNTLVSTKVYPTDPGYHDPATSRLEYTVANVSVKQGDVIKIEGTKDGAAFARMDKLIFDPVSVGAIFDGKPITNNQEQMVRAMPNPMRDRVTFVIDHPAGAVPQLVWELTIFGNAGTIVHTSVGTIHGSPVLWDGCGIGGNPVGNGVYYYQVRLGSQTFSGRIMVAK